MSCHTPALISIDATIKSVPTRHRPNQQQALLRERAKLQRSQAKHQAGNAVPGPYRRLGEVLVERGWLWCGDRACWEFPPSTVPDALRYPEIVTTTCLTVDKRTVTLYRVGLSTDPVIQSSPPSRLPLLSTWHRNDHATEDIIADVLAQVDRIEQWCHGSDAVTETFRELHKVLTDRGWALDPFVEHDRPGAFKSWTPAEPHWTLPRTLSGMTDDYQDLEIYPASVAADWQSLSLQYAGPAYPCPAHRPPAGRRDFLPGPVGLQELVAALPSVETPQVPVTDLVGCVDYGACAAHHPAGVDPEAGAGVVCGSSFVVEHADGTVECDRSHGVCFAEDHERVGADCFDVAPRPLAYDCGACWSSM